MGDGVDHSSQQIMPHPKYQIKETCPKADWIGDDPSKSASEKALSRFSVEGKNAVISGGARGMGLDAAYAVLEHGAQGVLLLDVLEDNLAASKRQLESLYPDRTIATKTLDVASASQTQEAVEYSNAALESVDIVLVFAGIVNCKSIEDHTPDEWNRVMNIDSTGSFYTAKYFGEKMINQGTGGSIVFISSIAGHGALFPQPQVAYNAAKAAVLGMMSSFATEWAQHGIRCNSISPGFMDTILNAGDSLEEHRTIWKERMPIPRLGERGSLNGAIMLLVSQAGSYITGTDIFVDGGIHASIV